MNEAESLRSNGQREEGGVRWTRDKGDRAAWWKRRDEEGETRDRMVEGVVVGGRKKGKKNEEEGGEKKAEKPRKGQGEERSGEERREKDGARGCVRATSLCARLIWSMGWRRADGSPVRASLEGDDSAGLMIPGENNET